ncbi:hypothetical protein, partial [Photobacterium toruni]|uniref:hypothetical protein n=1 Tax=Photobacterium toruni TaxID=1935446 RepID=UPI001B302F5B
NELQKRLQKITMKDNAQSNVIQRKTKGTIKNRPYGRSFNSNSINAYYTNIDYELKREII